MVLEAVEVVERRATSRVGAARASSVGVEVPLQGHGTHGETSGIGRAMQIAVSANLLYNNWLQVSIPSPKYANLKGLLS